MKCVVEFEVYNKHYKPIPVKMKFDTLKEMKEFFGGHKLHNMKIYYEKEEKKA